MSALLTVRGLCKRHGERLLFDIDELSLEAASAYVLTGANGVGKSTLLRSRARRAPSPPPSHSKPARANSRRGLRSASCW